MIDISVGDIVQCREAGGTYVVYLILRETLETNESICYDCLSLWPNGAFRIYDMVLWKHDSYREFHVIGHIDLTDLKLLR